MKIFVLALVMFFSAYCWGQSITMTKDSYIYGYGNNSDVGNQLFVEVGNASATNAPGNASSTDSASTVYIPIFDKYLDKSNAEYSIFSTATSDLVSLLPSFNDSATNTSYIKHQFDISGSNTAFYYLYAGLVNSDGIYIISKPNNSPDWIIEIPQNRTVNKYDVPLNVYAYCKNTLTPCKDLEITGTTPKTKIYFFLSTESNLSSDDVIKIPEGSLGVYFNYKLSNLVSGIEPPIIESVAKGDERAKVNYTGKLIDNPKDVIAIKYPDTSTATEQNFYEALLDGGVVASDENGTNESGSLNVKNLVNGVPVRIGIAYVNKFNFASKISDSEMQTPEKIQVFLEEKECYLLSAGFQKDHYVLEYFREIRDNFLLKNMWGRDFVKWYYRTAPYYAGIIYENTVLRSVVRSLGYLAYFTIRFLPILLAFLLIIFTFRRFKLNRG